MYISTKNSAELLNKGVVFIFITRLDSLIAEKGISKAQFVRDMKLGKNAILYWRKGNLPNSATLDAIAEYFDVTTDYLLAKADNKKSPSEDRLSKTDYDYLMLFKALPPSEQQRLLDYGELLLLKQKQSQSL